MTIQQIEDVSEDALLGALGKVLTQNGGSMGVTLNVAGQILDGLLVSRDRWLGELRAVVKSQATPGAAGDLLNGIAKAWERTDAEEADTAIDDGETDDETAEDDKPSKFLPGVYLHLVDVDVVGQAQRSGMAWRVRLSEVSAWSLQSRERTNT